MIFMGAFLLHTIYVHTTIGHEDSYIELYNNLWKHLDKFLLQALEHKSLVFLQRNMWTYYDKDNQNINTFLWHI
jgi:hypothetical protein